MKIMILGTFAALLSAMAYSQSDKASSGLRLYDNFNQTFIDPSKWSAQGQCGSPAMEYAREIKEGKLRLRTRAYGATDSDTGTQFVSSGVNLTASSVTDISVQVMVRNSSQQDCASNPGAAHSQVLVFGAFFNGGGGTAADDVQAFLQLDRYPSEAPQTVEVGGFLYYHGQFFGNVDLGPVDVGEQVTVELRWDQPNHRFILHLVRPAHNTRVERFMPYTISDTTAAVFPFKTLSANVFPANCTTATTSADLDVFFDNVMTN
jgi:hypothetical protein